MTVYKKGDVVKASQNGVDMVPVLPASVWSKLNAAMTDEERVLFNEWRLSMYTCGDRIRDISRMPSASRYFADNAKLLMRSINTIPFMEGQ